MTDDLSVISHANFVEAQIRGTDRKSAAENQVHPLCPDLFEWDFQSVIKPKCIGKLWATVHGLVQSG